MGDNSDMTDDPFKGNGRPARAQKPREDFKFQKQTDDVSAFENLLSAEEIADLREQARAQVYKEQKDREKAALLAKYVKEERQALVPAEQLSPILLHLAPTTSYIMLDGKQFFTDTVYEVTDNVAAVLIEQMNRGWAHEEVTQVTDAKGRRRWRPPPGIGYGNFMGNRTPRNLTLSQQQVDGAIASMHRTMQG